MVNHEYERSGLSSEDLTAASVSARREIHRVVQTLRALIAADVDNLALAGRCISGDFHAHASYRVTGNSVATGEGAGTLAALAPQDGIRLSAVSAEAVRHSLHRLRAPATEVQLAWVG